MKARCSKPNSSNYRKYGAKGISYDKKWDKFENFYKDMGDTYRAGLTLERINGKKNYSKQNCKWATYKEQNRNKSDSVIYKGENAIDASIRLGGKKGLVTSRITTRGWSIKDAFTLPVNSTKNYGNL